MLRAGIQFLPCARAAAVVDARGSRGRVAAGCGASPEEARPIPRRAPRAGYARRRWIARRGIRMAPFARPVLRRARPVLALGLVLLAAAASARDRGADGHFEKRTSAHFVL